MYKKNAQTDVFSVFCLSTFVLRLVTVVFRIQSSAFSLSASDLPLEFVTNSETDLPVEVAEVSGTITGTHTESRAFFALEA